MSEINNSGLRQMLDQCHQSGKPIVGICLGAQLFFSELEECTCNGLGWISGAVKSFPQFPFYNTGWCELDVERLKRVGLGRSIRKQATFYFNHKYLLPTASVYSKATLSSEIKIPAILADKNLVALQFHPEKSQSYGRILLRNVIEDYYGL